MFFLSQHGLPGKPAAISEGTMMILETMFFTVEKIDGDYAHLRRTDKPSEETRLVARALLPEEIIEGSTLKYEMLQYELISR